MRRYISRIIITFLMLAIAEQVSAQSELALYRFGRSVPQAGMINASFIPDYKVVIGLPLLSNYVHADNDHIAYRDMFIRDENDSLQLDRVGLPAKLNGIRRVSVDTEHQLFLYGIRILRFYITIGANLHLQTRLTYPGSLAGWAIVGPADPLYEGTDLKLDEFSVDAMAYHEYFVGAARAFGPLSVGARVRYLIGLGAVRTNQIQGALHVGIDSVSVQSSSIVVNTAGISFFDEMDSLDVKDYIHYAFGSKNKGLAMDLGAAFKVNDKLTVSAAVNDIGYINWKEYTKRYEIKAVNYSFKGFDVVDYLYNKNTTGIQAEVDSLNNLFDPTKTTDRPFTTTLVPKVYAGLGYKVGKVSEFGLVAYTDIHRGNLHPAVGLSYSLRLGRMIQAVVGGSYSNGKVNNVGAGLSLKLGPLQVYTVSDRANGLLYPSRTSWMNVRGGINFVFGRVKEKNKRSTADSTGTAQTDTLNVQPVLNNEAPPARDTVAISDTTRRVKAIENNLVPALIPDTTKDIVVAPDTTRQTNPPIVATEVEQEPIIEHPIDRVIVTRGTRPDELPLGNYVIVGVFKSKQNAAQYSARLQAANFYNSFGYVSEKAAYYVQVYYSKDDLQAVRQARDQFRKMKRFEFPNAWVLTIKE